MTIHHQSSRQKARLATVFLAVTAFFVSVSDARIFTSAKDGRTLEGKILGATEETVRLQIGTRQVQIPLKALIDADQRYIELWSKEQEKTKTPDLEISVNTGVNRRRDPSYGLSYYYLGSFDFKITIENDERDFDFMKAEATLVVIGENCVRGFNDFAVMQKETFPINLKAKTKMEWQGQEIRYRFAEDHSYQNGYKYHSYVLQIKNESGKVVFAKVMAPRFKGHMEKILKYKERDRFSKDANAIKGSSSAYIDFL